MEKQEDHLKNIPLLFIPRSSISSVANKTGSWRFLKPRYDQKTSPCSVSCPLGEDISRIMMLTNQGQFKEAWESILCENPLPGVCGRVCFHPCETGCNRSEFDEPVAVHVIERFLADTAMRYELKPKIETRPNQRKKIAIIGAGPSGLAAGYFLRILGYSCSIFEATEKPGGMLRWAIPQYRLPRRVVDAEIAFIESLGVNIICNQSVTEQALEEVKEEYDAIFVGCGFQTCAVLGIPGEDLPGVEDGLMFLKRVSREELPTLSGSVAVIGGGNTAIDVARSVLRCGGKPLIIYRRKKGDMPAFPSEVREAAEEGVEIIELKAPVRIEKSGNGLVITLRDMKILGKNSQGRSMVELLDGSEEQITVTRVYKAIGSGTPERWIQPSLNKTNSVKLSHAIGLFENNAPPIIYGGDLATPFKSVANALASGKQTAILLDLYFKNGLETSVKQLEAYTVGNGTSLSMEIYLGGERSERTSHVVSYDEINTDYFHFAPRIPQPRLLKEERITSFAEIDLKISASVAIKESERCFNCGICNQCDNCYLFCPDIAVVRDFRLGQRRINYDYCKGCGLCVAECPRNAMVLEEEEA